MAESSLFWTTGSTGDGQNTYGETQFSEWMRATWTGDRYASEGVMPSLGNQLAVSGTSSPISVADGAAYVNGFYYQATAAVSLAVSTPTIGTTAFRVNLAADQTAKTVRAVISMGTDGSTTLPSLTQTENDYWEIPLATGTIDTSGTISLTDARTFLHAVMAPASKRLGGSSSDWTSKGSTSYATGSQYWLCGAATMTFDSDNDSDTLTVTWPITFAYKPLVLYSVGNGAQANGRQTKVAVESVSTTKATFKGRLTNAGSWSSTVTIYWTAIGPKA